MQKEKTEKENSNTVMSQITYVHACSSFVYFKYIAA